MGILKEIGKEGKVRNRPAKLYSFDEDAYNNAVNNGFNFEI